MSTIAIVQARMGSTRLPGKVLERLGEDTMLGRVVRRLGRAALLDGVAVATTDQGDDDAVVREAAALGVRAFRGDAEDVLDRFHRATQALGADVVVRITADCPFIDPEIVDQVVRAFHEHQADYASNILERTYPRGLDTEVFSRAALRRTWAEATEPFEREHVTPYFYRHPTRFRLYSLRAPGDYSPYRWTVDTAEDLTFARAVYEAFGGDDRFSWMDVVRLLEARPELPRLNRDVPQKPLVER